MQKTPLGRLEEVDVRTVWASEAIEFTPWLAEEENLSLLGDTIGIELELEAQEKNVGPFRADLLCKDTANNSWVLIENQLARTDHTHLGQLMTYAAGLKAVTIVWLAKTFTEEHRAALDWLNNITDDKFNFFGLEVELWQIAGSPVAPKFNVVCKPNDWSKSVSSTTNKIESSALTETKLLQQEYWAALRECLLDAGSPVKPHKPLPQHWTSYALGRSFFGMHANVNTQQNSIRVAASCYGPDAGAHFFLLKDQKNTIEREIGSALDWEELPNRKECRVSLKRDGTDPTDRSGWPEQHQWFVDYLGRFYQAFSPRIKKLDADQWEAAATHSND